MFSIWALWQHYLVFRCLGSPGSSGQLPEAQVASPLTQLNSSFSLSSVDAALPPSPGISTSLQFPLQHRFYFTESYNGLSTAPCKNPMIYLLYNLSDFLEPCYKLPWPHNSCIIHTFKSRTMWMMFLRFTVSSGYGLFLVHYHRYALWLNLGLLI